MRRSPQASFSPGDLPTQLPQLLLRSSPDPSPWASALPQLYFCLWTCSSPPVSFLASLDGSQQLSQCPTELAKGIPTLSSQQDALEQFPSTPFLMSAAVGMINLTSLGFPPGKTQGTQKNLVSFGRMTSASLASWTSTGWRSLSSLPPSKGIFMTLLGFKPLGSTPVPGLFSGMKKKEMISGSSLGKGRGP